MAKPFTIPYSHHRNADFKDTLSEKKFLGGLLWNRNIFEKTVIDFNPDVFTNIKLKKIYNKLVEMYLRDKSFINDVSIISIMDLPKDRQKVYRALFKNIKRLGSKHKKPAYLLAARYKLEQLYRGRIIELGMRDVLKSLAKANDGDFKAIGRAGETLKVISNMADVTTSSAIRLNPVEHCNLWLRDFEDKQSSPDKYIGIPTGLPPIDKRITGLRDAELGLCVADTGVGKSIFLLDCAVNCWRKSGSVIYVTIEMPANQLEDRYWCNLTGIHYDKFRKLALNRADKTKIRDTAKRFRRKHDHSFIIIDMPEGCTVSAIRREIEPYLKTSDLKLVVIDYMNIIASATTGAVELDWQVQVEHAMNLKQDIARRYNLPVWSACQITGDHMAFARHIKDNIDIGVQFTELEETDETGIMEVSYPKTRDFKGTVHKIKTDRAKMTMMAVNKQSDDMVQIGATIR